MDYHRRGNSQKGVRVGFLFFVNRYDFAALSGLILTAVGLYMIYPPLALIVPGVFLVVAGVLGSRP